MRDGPAQPRQHAGNHDDDEAQQVEAGLTVHQQSEATGDDAHHCCQIPAGPEEKQQKSVKIGVLYKMSWIDQGPDKSLEGQVMLKCCQVTAGPEEKQQKSVKIAVLCGMFLIDRCRSGPSKGLKAQMVPTTPARFQLGLKRGSKSLLR